MIYQTQKNCWQGLADRCQQFFFTSSHELSQKKLSLPKINSMSSPQTTSYAQTQVACGDKGDGETSNKNEKFICIYYIQRAYCLLYFCNQ